MNQLILGGNLEIMRKMDNIAVDNEGMEAIEVVKVKINGMIAIK